MSQQDDHQAIEALIHRSRVAIWMRDYAAWAACFVHADYTARWGSWGRGGVFARRGWDDIATRLQREMAERPVPQPTLAYQTRVENLSIQVRGDMAWATFEQHYPEAPPWEGFLGPEPAYDMRVFERHEGEWKIAFLCLLDSGQRPPEGMVRLRLDREGRLLEADAPILKLLDDDDLVLRSGRLRIRDSRADAKLQAAIRWAAGLDAGFMPQAASVPIVSEAGEGLPTKVWWVSGRGATILFSTTDPRTTAARLALAATVYGLSPAQARVAAFVADGLSVVEIADRLGISPSTARTHLNRIFDKTGVRTQSSLVRLLLLAVAPY